jgi:hypothetical protein
MSFSRPIQWYYSYADPIWQDGTFKPRVSVIKLILICWDLRIICVVCRERELHMVRQASSRIFHLRNNQLKRKA